MTILTRESFSIRKRAFTLIELILVVAIGVILLSTFASYFSGYVFQKSLESLAVQMQQDLIYARSQSMMSGNAGRYEIYFFKDRYYCERKPDAQFNPLNRSIVGDVVLRKIPYQFSIKLVDINNGSVSLPPSQYIKISFDDFGCPNYFSPASSYGIFLSRGGIAYRISLSLTGLISLERLP
ncbi:MAG: prepilin-type N-terminal cleavage/methylation domain-containing protein [Nitrososphaeria archaeon]